MRLKISTLIFFFTWVGLVPTAPAQTVDLPKAVKNFLERAGNCIHFSGEEPYDDARAAEIRKNIEKSCPNLKSEARQLRNKFQYRPDVLKEIGKTSTEYKSAFGESL